LRRRAITAGRVAIAAVMAALMALPGPVAGRPLPGAPRCPMFPADNPWNQRVDRLPVAPDSATLIASIGLDAHAHPDFGSGLYAGEPIGIPFAVVSRHTRRVPVSFQYSSESDGRLYPLPRNVPIEGGRASTGDRQVIVLDRDSCRDYELYAAYPQRGGASWRAGSGAIFDLRSDRLRPAGWTSADAAGLPICRGWSDTTRSPAARSTTRCGSPLRPRAPRTSTRRAIRQGPRTTRRYRRWDCGFA
jgi:hypothetical protein